MTKLQKNRIGKKLKDSIEIAIVASLIIIMFIPILIVCLCLWPIRYIFDLRLQQKEKDKYNS